ncbi:TetR/AcrR family transcriptional regulator [Achromobacter sp. Marseille-Q0513]|uniref:TetR/AcrR family transcriptional regulator n=1 Tax=Achromobacter sp. Marseille-Q0513 TaxID=2829161 RepID=UPI001BA3DEFB|nr:TetR/AcrR family transcriptional regulator [Achromobacter sp. Marseille-Q0513]MBR8652164.1 TetR/AcrR family transcriptional regulator [Achromobacter sp. Marseille-Q0513]
MSRTRAEMIEATRVKLLAAARKAFRESGYAAASMDELTAAAGLTRGALYHHFGDKQGLLAAVAAELDQEMDQRLQRISDAAPDAWTALRERCRAWLHMATEPEIQRIALQDARAVLGPASEAALQPCIASLAAMLQSLMDEGQVHAAAPQALARLINGALMDGAFWIAAAPDDGERLEQALRALDLLLDGLRRR